MTTIFLHGFWGSPADWTPVLTRLPLGQGTWCPDLYRDEGLGPDVDPLAWADRFVHRARAEHGPGPVQLVGYSMGGRLGLHAVLRVPGFFARTLVLSADPGVTEDPNRAAWEEGWAARFADQPWDRLEAEWSAEPVLKSSGAGAVPKRRDDDLRPRLADSLRRWSPRAHAFTLEDLRATPARIDWACGATDAKYAAIAERLPGLIGAADVTIIPGAGHRLTHDAPDHIARWVSGQTS